MKIKDTLFYIINLLIPKYGTKIYVQPLYNTMKEKADIVNFSSSSVLTYIHFLIDHDKKIDTIYIECYTQKSKERCEKYINEKQLSKNIKLLLSSRCEEIIPIVGKFYSIINTINRFKCRLWLCDTILTTFPGKIKNVQIIACLGYFTSFKNDYDVTSSKPCSADIICVTSENDARIQSSAYGIPLNRFFITGLARNDNLEKNEINKKKLNYFKKKFDIKPNQRIVLYAPTYRDYETDKYGEGGMRDIFGFATDNRLSQLLQRENIVLLAKLHAWQNSDITEKESSVIIYSDDYEYTIYDILPYVDVLISDYSSIAFDFLLIDRPIIFNHYDYEKFEATRGFSYKPISYLCPGPIVKNFNEFYDALECALSGKDNFKERRKMVQTFTTFYKDFLSCNKVTDVINKVL